MSNQYSNNQTCSYANSPHDQPLNDTPKNNHHEHIEIQQEAKSSAKFKENSKRKDCWASILYITTLISTLVLGVLVFRDTGESLTDLFAIASRFSYRLLIAPVVSLVVSIALCTGYFLLMLSIPNYFTQISFMANIFLALFTAAFLVLNSGSQKILSLGPIIMAILLLIFYLFCRKKMPLTSMILNTAAKFTKRYPGIIFMMILIAFLYFLLALCTVFAYLATLKVYKPCDESGSQKRYCKFSVFSCFFPLFFSLTVCWTFQLLKDVVHITISYLFACDYFKISHKKWPTFMALKRAVTTSFGSVCFGSLLISICRMLRASTRGRNQIGCIAVVMCCLSSFIRSFILILEYFNMYAYTYVSIYGNGYIEAGKRTRGLIKHRGIDGIINDLLLKCVLVLGSVFLSTIPAFLTYLFLVFSSNSSKDLYILPMTLLAYIISLLVYFLLFVILRASATSFFVCLADDPQRLEDYDPSLYAKMKSLYPHLANQV